MTGFSITAPPDDVKRDFEAFLSQAGIIECSRKIADMYGEIFADLRGKGAMIPINDIWIAACCIAANKKLATRNTHFQKVAGLKYEMW